MRHTKAKATLQSDILGHQSGTAAVFKPGSESRGSLHGHFRSSEMGKDSCASGAEEEASLSIRIACHVACYIEYHRPTFLRFVRRPGQPSL